MKLHHLTLLSAVTLTALAGCSNASERNDDVTKANYELASISATAQARQAIAEASFDMDWDGNLTEEFTATEGECTVGMSVVNREVVQTAVRGDCGLGND